MDSIEKLRERLKNSGDAALIALEKSLSNSDLRTLRALMRSSGKLD